MLQFGLAAALEVLHATIGSEACWIPETHWVLHSELVLERTQRRCGVVGPVTPGASGETILTWSCKTKTCQQNTLTSRNIFILYEHSAHTFTNIDTLGQDDTSRDFCKYVDPPPERTCR